MNTDNRTDEELNCIIAEWLGWKWEPHASGTCLRDPSGSIVNNNYAEDWRLPNYCRDLNAVHEAESKLSADQAWLYNRKLSEAHGTAGGMGSGVVCEWSWHSTARQRSEALVRVIEESKK